MTATKGARRPDTPKKALGHQLMLCRTNAGYHTQPELAKAMGISVSPIAKVESGDRAPSPPMFEDWLLKCSVSGQLAIAIESIFHLARMKDDPQGYQFDSWEDVEEQATSLMFWELTLVPGIAQTEDYARSLFEMWRNTPERVNELTARRVKRRDVLTRPEAPDVVIVLWERVLYTLVGTPEIMVAQLEQLIELSNLPNVYLHVLPASVRAGMGTTGPVWLASSDMGEAVVMEGASESAVSEDVSKLKLGRTILNSVRASAKDEAESRVRIMEAIETWKAQAGGSPPTAVVLGGTASS